MARSLFLAGASSLLQVLIAVTVFACPALCACWTGTRDCGAPPAARKKLREKAHGGAGTQNAPRAALFQIPSCGGRGHLTRQRTGCFSGNRCGHRDLLLAGTPCTRRLCAKPIGQGGPSCAKRRAVRLLNKRSADLVGIQVLQRFRQASHPSHSWVREALRGPLPPTYWQRCSSPERPR